MTRAKIRNLYIDTKGMLWYFTEEDGVSKYNPQTKQTKTYRATTFASDYYIKETSIREVNNVIWVKMNKGGLEYYDSINDKFHPFPSVENVPNYTNIVHADKILEEGVLWLTFYNRGLYRYELVSEKVKRHLLDLNKNQMDENEVRALYYDREQDLLYIGNIAGKIRVYNSNKEIVKQWLTNGEGQSFGRIYNIYKDKKNRLWISTKGQGLYCIYEEGNHSKIVHFVHDANNAYSLSSNNVYATLCDEKGRIWVATYGGGVNLIEEGKEGFKFLSHKNVFKSYPLSTFGKVRSLAVGKNNQIWAGTSDGILIMGYDDKQAVFYCTQPYCRIDGKGDKIFTNDIIQITKDQKQRIWMATISGGLNLFKGIDKDGAYVFQSFGKSEGLPSDAIKSIVCDDTGILWLASDYNLCSFDPEKNIFSPFLPQDGIDGTMCSEGSAIVLEHNHILFGTISGIYEIDYRQQKQDVYADKLKLTITDFFVDGKLSSPRTDKRFNYYVPGDTIVKIPSRTSTFGFRFAVLNYKLQHRVRYQYRILKAGVSNVSWMNVDNSRTVYFSDMPAGTYYFEVKAFLLEYPDQYELKCIKVEVPPYFFVSPTAFVCYLVLFLMAFVGIGYWYRWQRKKFINRMRVVKIGPQEIAIRDKDDNEFITKQLKFLEDNYNNPELKIQDMVAYAGMSRTSYYIRIKSLLQIAPMDLLLDFRLKKAMMYLEKDNCTIAEIAFRVGFKEPTYFSQIFKQKIGMTPTAYRKQKTSRSINTLAD